MTIFKRTKTTDMRINKLNSIVPFLLLLIFTACDTNDAKSNEDNSSDSDSTTNSPRESSENSTSPCDLITIHDVENLFEIAGDITLTVEDEILTYPTCTYKWEDGKVTHSQNIGGQTIVSELPSTLMIVMVKGAIDVDYNTSIRVYKDGVSVSGVGQMSAWSDKRAQLSFLAKNHLFHVHVRNSNDSEVNKAKAIEIANKIIDKI